MKRYKLSRSHSRRLFKNTYNKTRKLNNLLSSRGGIRL